MWGLEFGWCRMDENKNPIDGFRQCLECKKLDFHFTLRWYWETICTQTKKMRGYHGRQPRCHEQCPESGGIFELGGNWISKASATNQNLNSSKCEQRGGEKLKFLVTVFFSWTEIFVDRAWIPLCSVLFDLKDTSLHLWMVGPWKLAKRASWTVVW